MCIIRWIGSITVQTNNDEMSVKAVCFPSSNSPTPHHGLINTSSLLRPVSSQPWTHNMRVLNYFTDRITKDNTNDGKLIRLKRKLGMNLA